MGMTFQVMNQHLQKPVGRQSRATLLTQRHPMGVLGLVCHTVLLGSPNGIQGVLADQAAKKDTPECHQARDRFGSLFVPTLIFFL